MNKDKVFINGEEMEIAKSIASEQTDAWYNSNVKYTKDFDNSSLEGKFNSQLVGILAEIGFGKMIGQSIRIPDGTFRKTEDFYFREWSVDVKGTYRRDGRLIAHYKKTNRDFDIFVLCRVNVPFVTFGGWAFAPEFIHPGRVKDLGHGSTYIFPNELLRTWDDLNALPGRNSKKSNYKTIFKLEDVK